LSYISATTASYLGRSAPFIPRGPTERPAMLSCRSRLAFDYWSTTELSKSLQSSRSRAPC